MNTDEHLINLMRHLDGERPGTPDKAFLQEVDELKQTVITLKEIPLEDPDSLTDQKLASFLEDMEEESGKRQKLNQWLPYILVAASLAMLLYLFLPKQLAQRYDLLESNPDRISFIHELNDEKLSREELLWLVSLLEFEEHPNIRVTLLDLLENQEAELPAQIALYLVKEGIPSVQMAFLNTLDEKYAPEMKAQLMAFHERKDLDPLVRKRIEGMLINK